jgi:hypothetical protein
MAKLESAIVAEFMALVKQLSMKGVPIKALKIHGGMFTSGQPDVLVVYMGLALFIEFKTQTGKTTKRQEASMSEWTNAGARCTVMRDARTALTWIASELAELCPKKKDASRSKAPVRADVPGTFDG